MSALHALLADPATAGVWNLVPARSSVRFKNKTLWGLVPVNGEFTDVSGDGQITAKGAVFGRVDVRAASVRTGIGKRDGDIVDRGAGTRGDRVRRTRVNIGNINLRPVRQACYR